MSAPLPMRRLVDGRGQETPVTVRDLVIAGWTGRDAASLERHIRELEAIGVRRPREVPCYYPVPADRLTTVGEIAVAGRETSGEAEFVLVALEDGLWVGVGSDHTDREMEARDVGASKEACPKPVGPDLWRFAEIAEHWDRLVLRSWVLDGPGRRLYQEGTLAEIRRPEDLIERYAGGRGPLPAGTAMFGGTLPAISPARRIAAFEVELEDPVRGRAIRHAYRVRG